ncbi:MAG: phosphopentomutase [Lachnospiraceae bacterium]|jgi:phosphopentomutase|nr:phosphopentomutase [Lachnospiraceae bacterium]
MKRIFLIVLDSVGIGAMGDAGEYGDLGTNTLHSAFRSPHFHMPNMKRLGLFNIDGIEYGDKVTMPQAALARMSEASRGKDTIIGHWEIAGLISAQPLPTYPEGFPADLLEEFCRQTGRGYLCNRPYSGTEVIKDFGDEHLATGRLIVYTSADSVFQIAAHEDKVPLAELYRYCEIARDLLSGDHSVGRVIARPFSGESGDYRRTAGRHDYALAPQGTTMLDVLKEAGKDVIGIGKIRDIFAGRGLTAHNYTKNNHDGMSATIECADREFDGLCFVNLVDFDMLFGHRNDIDGYARALSEFDQWLPELQAKLRPEDLLMITADHGCDPGYLASTDHSREYTPLLVYGQAIKPVNYGTRTTFADIGATILDYFDLDGPIAGTSLIS